MNAMKNPPLNDQGLAFQTPALQMILLGPFCVRTQHCYGPPRIVTLQFLFMKWRTYTINELLYIISYLQTNAIQSKIYMSMFLYMY